MRRVGFGVGFGMDWVRLDVHKMWHMNQLTGASLGQIFLTACRLLEQSPTGAPSPCVVKRSQKAGDEDRQRQRQVLVVEMGKERAINWSWK